jgi:hypothetical protein
MNTPENRNASGKAGVSVEGLQADDVKQIVRPEFISEWGPMPRPAIFDRIPKVLEECLNERCTDALMDAERASVGPVYAGGIVDAVSALFYALGGEASQIRSALHTYRAEAIAFVRSLRRQQVADRRFHSDTPARRARIEKLNRQAALRVHLRVENSGPGSSCGSGGAVNCPNSTVQAGLNAIGDSICAAGYPGVQKLTRRVRSSPGVPRYGYSVVDIVRVPGTPVVFGPLWINGLPPNVICWLVQHDTSGGRVFRDICVSVHKGRQLPSIADAMARLPTRLIAGGAEHDYAH